jgi:hypothetical protein
MPTNHINKGNIVSAQSALIPDQPLSILENPIARNSIFGKFLQNLLPSKSNEIHDFYLKTGITVLLDWQKECLEIKPVLGML